MKLGNRKTVGMTKEEVSAVLNECAKDCGEGKWSIHGSKFALDCDHSLASDHLNFNLKDNEHCVPISQITEKDLRSIIVAICPEEHDHD